MTIRALILIVWMLMTPKMMSAFGQIAGAEIISGCVDLSGPMTGTVYAVGKMEGQVWDITAEWENGYPSVIRFTNPQSDL
jgi:hypothetical protein